MKLLSTSATLVSTTLIFFTITVSAEDQSLRQGAEAPQEAAGTSLSNTASENGSDDVEVAESDLGGFPDKATLMQAQALGISRYEAFIQLKNLEAIKSYCKFAVQAKKIEDTKWAEIDAGGDETTISADTEVKHQAIRDEFNTPYGLVDFEYETLAQVGKWRTYCSAFSKGWGIFGDNSAARIEKADANTATDLIEGIYVEELNRPASQLQSSAFKAVNCKRKQVDDLWFTGCQLHGLSGRSNWLVYLLGKNVDDGMLFASPINGDSMEISAAIWPNVSNQARDNFAVAEFIGQEVDLAKTLEAFE